MIMQLIDFKYFFMGQSKAYKKLSELHYKSFVLLLVPAAGSPTATLLRLHPSHSLQSHRSPPFG